MLLGTTVITLPSKKLKTIILGPTVTFHAF